MCEITAYSSIETLIFSFVRGCVVEISLGLKMIVFPILRVSMVSHKTSKGIGDTPIVKRSINEKKNNCRNAIVILRIVCTPGDTFTNSILNCETIKVGAIHIPHACNCRVMYCIYCVGNEYEQEGRIHRESNVHKAQKEKHTTKIEPNRLVLSVGFSTISKQNR